MTSTENTSNKTINLEEIQIEPFDGKKRQTAFCCGVENIDNFFKYNAKKQHNTHRVRVYQARFEELIVGYYYLVASTRNPADISEEAMAKFGRVGAAPCVYLGMIGVAKDFQKNGIGYILMLHAMKRALEVAQIVGIYALTLDALNNDVAAIYEKWNFQRFVAGELAMFIPISTIKELFAS